MRFAENNVICIDLVNKKHWNIVFPQKDDLNICQYTIYEKEVFFLWHSYGYFGSI